MRFSIITSYYANNNLRIKQLQRAVQSVRGQSFTDYEHILYNDGSPNEVDLGGDREHVYLGGPHFERIIAANRAIEKAKGEWIVFLDADDELFSYSLECWDEIIRKNTGYKMFNCASLHVSKDYGTHIRGSFKPKEETKGHEVFGGGNIVNGTFIFKRECVEKHGAYPPDTIEDIDCTEINYGGKRNLMMVNPWDFSAYAQIEFPEIRKYYMVDHEAEPNKIIKELGNPWGNDMYLFYKLTRHYKSKPFDIPLYIVHHEGKVEGDGHYVPETN